MEQTIEESTSHLAARLRAARAYAQLSQDDMAELLQVSRQAYSRWEKGATTPRGLMKGVVITTVSEATGLPEAFFEADFSNLEVVT